MAKTGRKTCRCGFKCLEKKTQKVPEEAVNKEMLAQKYPNLPEALWESHHQKPLSRTVMNDLSRAMIQAIVETQKELGYPIGRCPVEWRAECAARRLRLEQIAAKIRARNSPPAAPEGASTDRADPTAAVNTN